MKKPQLDDDDRKFESYLKEVRTLFRNYDLDKEYIFSAVKTLQAEGNEDTLSVDYQININFGDYPRKIQGQMNKMKATLEKSKFSEIVNFDPNYVMSIGEEFENFKARKLNVSGVETELSMRYSSVSPYTRHTNLGGVLH